jgi:hypothetical protein
MAERAGLSKHQQTQAVRVANVPTEKFEAAIEAPKPATVTALAEMGKQVRVLARSPCALYQYSPAIQSRIFVDGTTFLGSWGLIVPAMALQPSAMTSCANCFASASNLNRRVTRAVPRLSPRLRAIFER